MKKTIILLMILSVVFLPKTAVAKEITNLNVQVNNNNVVFGDIKPFIDGGSVLVPLRFISEELKADVKWVKETKTAVITYKDKKIEIRANEKEIKMNGKQQEINTVAIIKGSSMFVPLRFMAETFGTIVDWVKETRTAIIITEYETRNGRIVRTWNLPKNSNEYEYILMNVPNEMYEKARVSDVYGDMVLPKDIKKDKWLQLKENLKLWCDTVEKNINLRINVDYKNIDYKWAEELAKTYFYGLDENIEDTKSYVDWVKENHIKITGTVSAEPSMTYMARGGVWVRCYVNFTIENFEKNQNVICETLLDNRFVAKNKTYDGYVDFMLGTNNVASLGQDLWIVHEDSALIMTMQTLPPELEKLYHKLYGGKN